MMEEIECLLVPDFAKVWWQKSRIENSNATRASGLSAPRENSPPLLIREKIM